MLIQAYLFVLIFVAFVGVYRFRQLDTSMKIISALLVYTAIHEWVGQVDPLFSDFRLYWLYGGISAAFYVLAFRNILVREKQKTLLLVFAIAIAAIGVVKFFSISTRFPSAFILSSILLIVFSALLGLFALLEKSDDRPLYQNVHFLMASNIIVYQCTFFTYLGYFNTVMSSLGNGPLIVDLHISFSILYYLCFGIAFLLPQKSPTPSVNAFHL